jgi:hypothetical protein
MRSFCLRLLRSTLQRQSDIRTSAMTRLTFRIAVAFLCITAGAAPLVTYETPCECRDNHGKHRWSEKNDRALPPAEASAIQAVTPSHIFSWQGPTEYLVPSSERIWSEQKWYALTGRIVDLRAEEDGDLHIALAAVAGDKPGTVVVEIPAKLHGVSFAKLSLVGRKSSSRFASDLAGN